MSDYYDDEPTIRRTIGKIAFAAGFLVVGYLGYTQLVTSGSAATPTASAASAPTTALSTAPTTAALPAPSTSEPGAAAVTTQPVAATEAAAAAPTTTSATARAVTPSNARPATATTVPAGAPPVTLPDGSAAPVVAIFDVATITLAGAVPDQAAADLLTSLAVANSKTPAAVIDLVTIDPSVPEGVGIRVVELNSSRFPAGSAEVLPAHAPELDRMAAVMNALPNVTVLVIGHADQVGSEQNNFALSEERAQAVVHYLVDQGIDPSRLSSRAVGESDLLSVDDDETSLALNRRTEFIVYGALVGA